MYNFQILLNHMIIVSVLSTTYGASYLLGVYLLIYFLAYIAVMLLPREEPQILLLKYKVNKV